MTTHVENMTFRRNKKIVSNSNKLNFPNLEENVVRMCVQVALLFTTETAPAEYRGKY